MKLFRKALPLLLVATTTVTPLRSHAQEASTEPKDSEASLDEKILDRITVVGSSENVSSVAGAAAVLDGEAMENAKTGVGDITRALRQIPGVNIVEEDAFGLRPNIGMRGSPSERSASITLMEDGVLAAPAPYAAPAAYYFPTFGRMQSMEVVKGAGQIKYGPRTTGGSINLISTEIPDQFKVSFDGAAGSYSTERAHLYVGESFKNVAYMLETYQMRTDGFKELDSGGDTGFDLQDYLGKFRINTDRNAEVYQQLQLKVGRHTQDANDTYLGLTKEDFDQKPNRRYAASQNDNVNITQEQYQLQHYIEPSDSIDVTTTGYYQTVDRDWNKLDSVNGQSLSSILENPSANQDAYEWLTGTTSPADALSMRDANRDYYAGGVQSVMVGHANDSVFDHRVELGARYHQDQEDRKQQDNKYQMFNGSMVETFKGAPLSQTNRVADAEATAVYLQDTLSTGSWRFVPGLRYEGIHLEVTDYGKNDPNRTGANKVSNTTDLNVWIPGIGTEYTVTDNLALFGGIHKGFSPPGPTLVKGVKEEESIAYEIGTNIRRNSLVSQFTVFFNDYDNLLGVDSLSSGGTGTGDPFNLGKAFTYGVESSIQYNVLETVKTEYRLPVYGTYTFTDAEFRSTFKSDYYGNVESGDKVPYIAPNQFAIGAGVEHDRYGKFLLRSYFVQSMLTQPAPGQDVDSGPSTDSYFVLDTHIESPDLHKGLRLYVDATNVLDNEYIVAWRPAGARPGAPRTVLGGVKFTF
jgi:Fe(3+) dicitrate transport protein